MTFSEFKTALLNFEETERSTRGTEGSDNVMAAKQQMKFQGKCFKCGIKGHKSSECRVKSQKWCGQCRSKSHDTKECWGKKDTAKTAALAPVNMNSEHFETHNFAFKVEDDTNNCKGKNLPNLLVGTGATSHIVNDQSKFVDFDPKFDASTHSIELADGSKANVVLGKGNAMMKLYDVNGNLQDVMLKNALYIPSYKQNIFSVSAAVEKGASLNLDQHVKQLIASDGSVFNIKQEGRLYYLNSVSSSKTNAN